ncbi:hypothetical protein [Corynebacterium sp.]|uniref:hypothetical protein n=1 Tax=Corynebacterium sp. TaxID=1720 RepID=UPI0026475058|nr:hypothetical protein [Corynebacterium sp.]MDN5721200.1 hypothetical protein [Corynebacterium sp.]
MSHTYVAVSVYVPAFFHPRSNPHSGADQPCAASLYFVPVPEHTVVWPSPRDHFTVLTFAVAVIEYGPAVAVAESEGNCPFPSPTHNHTGTPTVPWHDAGSAKHGDAPIFGAPIVIREIALSRT